MSIPDRSKSANALAGLSGKPQEYPWQAHARGLLAHLVYGVVLDIGVRQARKLLG